MPHDCKGRKIEKGDVVTIAFTVMEVQGAEAARNVSLLAVPPPGWNLAYLPHLACNAGLTTKVVPPPPRGEPYTVETNGKTCRRCGVPMPSPWNYGPGLPLGGPCEAATGEPAAGSTLARAERDEDDRNRRTEELSRAAWEKAQQQRRDEQFAHPPAYPELQFAALERSRQADLAGDKDLAALLRKLSAHVPDAIPPGPPAWPRLDDYDSSIGA